MAANAASVPAMDFAPIPATATFAPSAANALAIARPKPPPPANTKAVLSFRPRSMKDSCRSPILLGVREKLQVPPLRYASAPRQAGAGGMTNLFVHQHSNTQTDFVIPRGCNFFDFPRFCHAQPDCCLKLPQGRHPERSASQIYRLTEGFWRGVEGPRVCHLTDAVRSFSTKRVCMAAENVGVGAGHT